MSSEPDGDQLIVFVDLAPLSDRGLLLLAQLARPMQVLQQPGSVRPDRHRTQRAAIDWRYRRLTPDEQTLMGSLAVFAGGEDLDAVTRVCAPDLRGPLLPALAGLVEKNLLDRVSAGGSPRTGCWRPSGSTPPTGSMSAPTWPSSGSGTPPTTPHWRWTSAACARAPTVTMACVTKSRTVPDRAVRICAEVTRLLHRYKAGLGLVPATCARPYAGHFRLVGSQGATPGKATRRMSRRGGRCGSTRR